MEEAGHMENKSSGPNQTSGRKALIVENRANCRLKINERKGPDRAVRPATRMWKFLYPDLRPGAWRPTCPLPGRVWRSQAVRNRPQNEEGRRTKGTRIAMEKSTKLKQLKTAKILTYQNESSMEKNLTRPGKHRNQVGESTREEYKLWRTEEKTPGNPREHPRENLAQSRGSPRRGRSPGWGRAEGSCHKQGHLVTTSQQSSHSASESGKHQSALISLLRPIHCL